MKTQLHQQLKPYTTMGICSPVWFGLSIDLNSAPEYRKGSLKT